MKPPLEASRAPAMINIVTLPLSPHEPSGHPVNTHDSQLVSSNSLINTEVALGRLRGDEQLLRDLMRFYLDDWVGFRASLQTSLDNGDRATLRRTAHSIAGLASNFEALSVVEQARSVENMPPTASDAELQAGVRLLCEAGDALAKELQTHCTD